MMAHDFKFTNDSREIRSIAYWIAGPLYHCVKYVRQSGEEWYEYHRMLTVGGICHVQIVHPERALQLMISKNALQAARERLQCLPAPPAWCEVWAVPHE